MINKCNGNTPLTAEQRHAAITRVSDNFSSVLTSLGFDWENDPHLRGTPLRYAKAMINDLISGCFMDKPNVTAFDNVDKYDGMVFSGRIDITSVCAHHFSPFFGHCYIAYLPDAAGRVIGLSKLNRIADFFARRPQVQENLTMNIHDYVTTACTGNRGVAVVVECTHLCCKTRGVKQNSVMITSKLSGDYLKNDDLSRSEFYKFIDIATQRG